MKRIINKRYKVSKELRTITASEIRARFRDAYNAVCHNRERVIITNYRDKCALISIKDLEKLERYETQEKAERSPLTDCD